MSSSPSNDPSPRKSHRPNIPRRKIATGADKIQSDSLFSIGIQSPVRKTRQETSRRRDSDSEYLRTCHPNTSGLGIGVLTTAGWRWHFSKHQTGVWLLSTNFCQLRNGRAITSPARSIQLRVAHSRLSSAGFAHRTWCRGAIRSRKNCLSEA